MGGFLGSAWKDTTGSVSDLFNGKPLDQWGKDRMGHMGEQFGALWGQPRSGGPQFQYQQAPYKYPGYESQIDNGSNTANGGNTAGLLKGNLSVQNQRNDGMDVIGQTATARPGSSPWERMQLQRQGLNEATNRQAMDQQMAGQTAGAQSSLAMNGGLTSGASERLAAQGAQNAMTERQNIARQGEADRLGIGIQGEQNRLGAAGNLATMQNQRSMFDVSNANQERSNAEQAKMMEYQEKMKAWAAQQMAQGYGQAQKGGGKK